jgi:hypothetical protein
MKSITLFVLLSSSLCCFAADDTNAIAVSDWSEPVELQNGSLHNEAIRGRLLIIEGSEPGYGGPNTETQAMTFVELKNATRACCDAVDVCFDVMKLNCTLTDESGKNVSKAASSGGYSGRGAFRPTWVVLPYNSTIRLFVNAGSRSPLGVYQNGEPSSSHWSISSNDTNVYYLSGTLDIFTRTNDATASMPESYRQGYYDLNCKGTLTFPKMKISARK